ncbi:MAG: phosphohydrolase, partial [Mycolicibacterium aromaticivorans]|nr:phosphohydrolase [Mycolicibacterium aromaticivorans]
AWPRHDLGYAIAEAIAADIRANPVKAPPLSFPAHLHHLINGAQSPTFLDMIGASGWDDRPVPEMVGR